jgi:hypothetical protein
MKMEPSGNVSALQIMGRFGVVGIALVCVQLDTVQSVVKESQAGVLLTMIISLGGVAVVIASATIEAVGEGVPSQSATTATLLSWAALVGILGVIFGAMQWKNAEVPEAVSETTPAT